MEEEKITSWLGWEPPEEKKDEQRPLSREEKRARDKQLILQFIREKVITYPNEIRRALGLSKDRVYDLLWELEREGKVKRHAVPMEPCECFKKRLPELWKMGIRGRKMFQIISWYTYADNPCPYAKNVEEEGGNE